MPYAPYVSHRRRRRQISLKFESEYERFHIKTQFEKKIVSEMATFFVSAAICKVMCFGGVRYRHSCITL